MARPPKERRVENIPEIKLFKPAGVPARDISEVKLTIEEVEAIRLKDIEGLTQEEAAAKMEVSRPTYQRVLVSAREKIADALIRGKALRFTGGDYRLADNRYYCPSCEKVFKLSRGRHGHGGRFRHHRKINCPQCGHSVTGENGK